MARAGSDRQSPGHMRVLGVGGRLPEGPRLKLGSNAGDQASKRIVLNDIQGKSNVLLARLPVCMFFSEDSECEGQNSESTHGKRLVTTCPFVSLEGTRGDHQLPLRSFLSVAADPARRGFREGQGPSSVTARWSPTFSARPREWHAAKLLSPLGQPEARFLLFIRAFQRGEHVRILMIDCKI